MGGDGGSIPRRIDQVRTKKRDQKLERDLENQIKWKMCALTQQRLKVPVACCELGRLYNKEALLEALIDKTLGENAVTQHLRSLKDVKTVKLTANTAYSEQADKAKGGEYRDNNASEYICPITGVEMNGVYRFVLLWSCGCVMSEKAVKEIKGDKCHVCGTPFDAIEDVVILNPTSDELPTQIIQMNERRARVKAAKKEKKSNKIDEPSTSTSGIEGEPKKQMKRPNKDKLGEPKQKKAAGEGGGNAGSIQNDPNASKVFKALFTSSEQAKEKEKRAKNQLSITFNPSYF